MNQGGRDRAFITAGGFKDNQGGRELGQRGHERGDPLGGIRPLLVERVRSSGHIQMGVGDINANITNITNRGGHRMSLLPCETRRALKPRQLFGALPGDGLRESLLPSRVSDLPQGARGNLVGKSQV